MNVFNKPVQLSKGINLRELLNSENEFHIDMDFKKKSVGAFLNADDDLYPDMGDDSDSDTEDVLKQIEEKTDKMMLASPEYHSFEQLSEKMADCVSGGHVKILIIEEDSEGPLIPVDSEVTIHYAAYWEKAKIPFDSSLTMNNGSPLMFVVYHFSGSKFGVYDVKDVQAAVRFNDLPSEEQSKFEVTLRTVKTIRADARDSFKNRKYKSAIKNYQQAITVLALCHLQSKEEEDEIKKLKLVTYVNLAVCYYKLNKPKYVIYMCENIDKIIDIETHCKSLFYYGRAYEMLGKTDLAIFYYKKALKLEPNNKDIGRTLADIDEKNKKFAKDEKAMWQKAFKAESVSALAYDVDEDFQNGVRDMCQDLAGRNDYSRFDLPLGLTNSEVECIKSLARDFEGLVVQEDGHGKRKKVTIIKKMLP
ncbi:hypothetical protein K1T71_000751 [Dendrolimus kikuchii]|uniref:Uncharacterized protein n=1 Tax=Dendrolimus kikuchii TaxID=765133 RepID=A0ACC1DK41_9NEOP|nr:hypothetical protein K1T71_000751 [Dendrolimus kikuchii]